MAGKLSIRVEPLMGSDLADVCSDAARLANILFLHHVEFSLNGQEWTVYPNFTGIGSIDSRKACEYRTTSEGICITHLKEDGSVLCSYLTK